MELCNAGSYLSAHTPYWIVYTFYICRRPLSAFYSPPPPYAMSANCGAVLRSGRPATELRSRRKPLWVLFSNNKYLYMLPQRVFSRAYGSFAPSAHVRTFATAPIQAKVIKYSQFGQPATVLKYVLTTALHIIFCLLLFYVWYLFNNPGWSKSLFQAILNPMKCWSAWRWPLLIQQTSTLLRVPMALGLSFQPLQVLRVLVLFKLLGLAWSHSKLMTVWSLHNLDLVCLFCFDSIPFFLCTPLCPTLTNNRHMENTRCCIRRPTHENFKRHPH